MIANERQHRISKAAIKRFQDAIAHAEADGPRDGVHPRLHAAMIDGLRSQRDELRGEVRAYGALRDGRVKRRVLHSIAEIPSVLIEGRIASRLTQRELAERISVPEQQIQRYEQTHYSGASIERLQEVAEALQLTVRKTVDFHIPAGRQINPRSSGGSHRLRTRTKGAIMANRSTGKAAGSAAGQTLGSKSASKAARATAASDLAQVANRKTTGTRAATAASRALRAKGSSKAARSAAGSDLSQAARKKKR
jgi:HTH-type transcriptional regulator/antitoxin HipB